MTVLSSKSWPPHSKMTGSIFAAVLPIMHQVMHNAATNSATKACAQQGFLQYSLSLLISLSNYKFYNNINNILT